MTVSITGNLDGINTLLQKLNALNRKAVYVGFPAEFDKPVESKNESVEDKKNFNLASLAAVLEFGNQHIPARPFLRQTLQENRQKYADFFAEQFKKGVPIETIYKRLADTVQGDVQDNIVKGNWTPNAAITIKRKDSSKPLIDTGRLKGSVRGVVK